MIQVVNELLKNGKKMNIFFENGDHVQTVSVDAVVVNRDIISFKNKATVTTYRITNIVKISTKND